PADKTLLKTIRAFGGHGRAKDGRPELIARTVHALNDVIQQGRMPVLVVDDAHAYDLEMLAEVGRMESAAIAAGLNMKLVLVGEQKLNELLERPELEFVSQRLAVSCRLEPMEQSDTRLYLNHRVTAAGGDGSNAFSRKAAREIHVASRGVASAINALAAESQRRATASSASVVTHDHVRAVVAETRRYAPKPGAVRPANGSSPRPSTVSSGAPGAARPGAPAASPPPARSASPPAPAQPPVYPPGGPRQAYPVPPKVKRVPPPPP